MSVTARMRDIWCCPKRLLVRIAAFGALGARKPTSDRSVLGLFSDRNTGPVLRPKGPVLVLVHVLESGATVPEIEAEDVREVFLRSYRIVYRVLDDELYVLTVFEGHRLLPEGARSDTEDDS